MGKNNPMKLMKPAFARNRVLRQERERKAQEAQVRKELASKRTPQEQLTRLDAGGFVATKERLKLAKKIFEDKGLAQEPVTAPSATTEEKKVKKGTKARRQAKKDKKAIE